MNNRGHMGGGNKEGDRIDNHRSYRVGGTAGEDVEEEEEVTS